MKPSEINDLIDETMDDGRTLVGTIRAIKVVLVDLERRLAEVERRLDEEGGAA